MRFLSSVSATTSGATGAGGFAGVTTGGSPTVGTYVVGDFVVAQNGYVWICVTAGTPGTWTRIAKLTSAAGVALGTASAGSSTDAARGDHVHPMPMARDLVRVSTLVVSANTYTPAGDTTDLAIISSPTANFTIAAPTGTPVDGQQLTIRIRSGATGYAATWNAIYQSSGVGTLPTAALPANKTVTVGLAYDLAVNKWVALAVDSTGY